MPLPLYIVDAFTDRPFAGNPAGVCVLGGDSASPGWPDAAWMQAVAAELKHSETAFVLPDTAGAGGDTARPIRYFTPAVEVALCGHATLAAAHALWQHGHAPPDPPPEASADTPLVFRTHEGQTLTCRRGDDDAIAMDFPCDPPRDAEAPPGLLEALGLSPSEVVHVARGRFDLLVQLRDPAAVKQVAPDFRKLYGCDTRGIAVTAPGPGRTPGITADGTSGGRPIDFVSRFFAPGSGIDEDPVTGSAHCLLGPYWADRLGKTDLLAHQASPRGGTLGVKVRADRVELRGQAVTVVRGQWLEPPAQLGD